jgi:glycosyltransferase involved in cell wall biosynthesis
LKTLTVTATDIRRDSVVIGPVFPLRVRHFAQALDESNRLRAFVAGYVYQPDKFLERTCLIADRALRTRMAASLQTRALSIDPARCRRAPVPEALYFVGRRLPLVSRLEAFRHAWSHHAWIDRFAAKHVLDSETRLVLGREDAAMHSFRRARELGAQTVYDLPTAHHQTVRRILEREEAEFPGVCRRPGVREVFTPAQLEHKEMELNHADHIIVGSTFVERSLIEAGYSPDAVTVIPSACEAAWLSDAPRRCSSKHGCLVLHVGYLSLRKGTHRLLRAWKRLGAYHSHDLRLIGEMCLSPLFLKDFQGCFEHVARLPREQLRPQYCSADFFVLPAAAEGFAAVILEALSCGVPIVASRNSGAEGFIEDGKEGLVHDFDNDDELCARLDWMLSHPRERAEMSDYARAKAAAWTWRDYRKRFLEVINSLEQSSLN